jgi:hypothetical protein
MAKRKNKKPKRAKYPHVMKTDYLIALANKIHCTAPQEQIIFNTLKDVYSTGYSAGYQRKHEEGIRFRQKQKQHLDQEFKLFQDFIDDLVHSKNISK